MTTHGSTAPGATWNAGPAFGSHGYPIALAAMALPISFVGGQLGARLRGDYRAIGSDPRD